MTVYIITQAWEGDIRGVYSDKGAADAACVVINANDKRPAVVEAHDIIEPATLSPEWLTADAINHLFDRR